jgi:general secretion pathway protein H
MSIRPSSTAGYSMLELLVVLAIMSLILVIALPAASGNLQRLSLSSDARLVASSLRSLREQAVNRQSDIVLTVSSARPDVLLVSSGGEIALTWGTGAQIFSRGNRGRSMILSWDGTVAGTIVLTRGGSTMRISADRLTGRVTVEGAP